MGGWNREALDLRAETSLFFDSLSVARSGAAPVELPQWNCRRKN